MKKLVMVVAASMFLAVSVPTAQANNTAELDLISVTDQETKKDKNKDKKDKTEVSVTDLPANVQSSLNGEAYRDWNPTKAWKIQKDDGVVYKVEVTDGTDTQTLKFDEAGNFMASKDK